MAHTFVISELSGYAHDAQLFGRDPGIFTKESKLVAHFDHQDSIHVLSFDLQDLLLQGSELAALVLCRSLASRLGAALGRRLDYLVAFFVVFVTFSKLIPSQRRVVVLHIPSPTIPIAGETAGLAELLDKLLVQPFFPLPFPVVLGRDIGAVYIILTTQNLAGTAKEIFGGLLRQRLVSLRGNVGRSHVSGHIHRLAGSCS